MLVSLSQTYIEPWHSGWTRVFVIMTDISSTSCCVKSSNLTSCRSLLESDTPLFPLTTWFTTPDPGGPHLCSCLLDVTLGDRQRVGAGLNSFGAVWSVLWDSGWTSSCTSKAGQGDVGVAGLESSIFLWCWKMVQLLSWKKYRDLVIKYWFKVIATP